MKYIFLITGLIEPAEKILGGVAILVVRSTERKNFEYL